MNENNLSTIYTQEEEDIAQAMLETRGDLAKASRLPSVTYNAMALRNVVRDNPNIRKRYHELLAEELQFRGLHIAERILKMVGLQEQAFGYTYTDEEGSQIEVPPDPRTAIELSKEISRLILEGKGQNLSGKAAVILANKEDAKEILDKFLSE